MRERVAAAGRVGEVGSLPSSFFRFVARRRRSKAPKKTQQKGKKRVFRRRERRLRRSDNDRRMSIDVKETPPSRLGRKGGTKGRRRAVKAFVGGGVRSSRFFFLFLFASLAAGEEKQTPETLSPPSSHRLPRRKSRPRALLGTLSTRLCDKNGDRSVGGVPAGRHRSHPRSLARQRRRRQRTRRETTSARSVVGWLFSSSCLFRLLPWPP